MDMENIAYTEARALLERILTQTDPVNNSATILLVHKSEIAKDANPTFVYETKATVDLLVSSQVIRVLNRPGDKDRTPDHWRYKVNLYRDKAEQLLRSLGKQITQAKPRIRKRPTLDQDGVLHYLGKTYEFNDKTSARYRLTELLTHRFDEIVDKESVYCVITGKDKLQYHDSLKKIGAKATHTQIKSKCKELRNEVFKPNNIGLTITSSASGIKLTSVNNLQKRSG